MSSVCLIADLSLDPVIEVYKEALWVLTNLVNCGTQNQCNQVWELCSSEEYENEDETSAQPVASR